MYPCEIVKNKALPEIFDKIKLDIRIILSNNFIAGVCVCVCVCYYRSIIYIVGEKYRLIVYLFILYLI